MFHILICGFDLGELAESLIAETTAVEGSHRAARGVRPPQFESPAPPPPALPRFIPSPNLNETGPLDVRGFRPASPPRRPSRRQARVEPYSRGGGSGQGGARSTRWDTPESSAGPMSTWSQTPSTSGSSSASSRPHLSAAASPRPGPSSAPVDPLPPPSTYPIDFEVGETIRKQSTI